jgi:hypothetical protein
MQKRRGYHNTSANVGSISLPMTESDLQQPTVLSSSSPTNQQRRRRRINNNGRRDYSRIWGCLIVTGVIVITGIYVMKSNIDNSSHGHQRRQRRTSSEASESLPLSRFKTLQYPFQHAKLVGLYFAASWCPHSTPVTEALDEYFGDIILPPARHDNEYEDHHIAEDPIMAPLAIVHVSSDYKETKFQKYLRHNWIPVPFDSSEQTELKRHFVTCSKPEVEELGINRKHEIPTLMIIDSETQTILTTNGVEDLDEYEENALDHWNELHDLVRAMEEKYYSEEEGGEDGSINHRRRNGSNNNNNRKAAANGDVLSSLFA